MIHIKRLVLGDGKSRDVSTIKLFYKRDAILDKLDGCKIEKISKKIRRMLCLKNYK